MMLFFSGSLRMHVSACEQVLLIGLWSALVVVLALARDLLSPTRSGGDRCVPSWERGYRRFGLKWGSEACRLLWISQISYAVADDSATSASRKQVTVWPAHLHRSASASAPSVMAPSR